MSVICFCFGQNPPLMPNFVIVEHIFFRLKAMAKKASGSMHRRPRCLIPSSAVVLRHTKVYLLAFDSIFVPSMYYASRVRKPFSANIITNCVNIRLISSFTRLRKRLMVLKSGCS